MESPSCSIKKVADVAIAFTDTYLDDPVFEQRTGKVRPAKTLPVAVCVETTFDDAEISTSESRTLFSTSDAPAGTALAFTDSAPSSVKSTG